MWRASSDCAEKPNVIVGKAHPVLAPNGPEKYGLKIDDLSTETRQVRNVVRTWAELKQLRHPLNHRNKEFRFVFQTPKYRWGAHTTAVDTDWMAMLFGGHTTAGTRLTYSQFLGDVNAGKVESATFLEGEQLIAGKLSDGSAYRTSYPLASQEQLAKDLESKGVQVDVDPQKGSVLMTILYQLLPVVFIVGAFLWMMNQSQAGGGRVMQFGRARAKQVPKDQPKTTFADVAGWWWGEVDLTTKVSLIVSADGRVKLRGPASLEQVATINLQRLEILSPYTDLYCNLVNGFLTCHARFGRTYAELNLRKAQQ